MSERKYYMSLKSNKVRQKIRDPCTYPVELRTGVWNDHAIENADRELKRILFSNKEK